MPLTSTSASMPAAFSRARRAGLADARTRRYGLSRGTAPRYKASSAAHRAACIVCIGASGRVSAASRVGRRARLSRSDLPVNGVCRRGNASELGMLPKNRRRDLHELHSINARRVSVEFTRAAVHGESP
jgi:hypothetical protein